MELLRRTAFFKLQRLIGSRVEACFREFIQMERLSHSELRSIQNERLGKLLKHAVRNIPYYRERVSDGRPLELSEFPILTKPDIRTNYYEMMTDKLRFEYRLPARRRRLYSWVEVKSGGSTGIPITVVHDREFRDRGRAARLYSQYLCGFPFGVPYFRIWGSMKDINQMKDSLAHKVMGILSGAVLMNAFRMSNNDIERYAQIINGSNIRHMMAYVDAAYEIARYSQKNNIKLKPLDSIMACAGTVTNDIRETLEDVFNTKVHNMYGSRDCATMACECDKGGLHIYSNNVVLEVVDSEGKPVPHGKTGRILVTLLYNYSFPIIRYEIGDVGALSSELCECGNPFPLMDKLEGRTSEFLLDSDGGYVSPAYIIHLVGVVHNRGIVKRFQLLQKSLRECELKLELENEVSEDIYHDFTGKVIRDLKAVLGENCDIIVRIVPRINETESGKFVYTINEVKTYR